MNASSLALSLQCTKDKYHVSIALRMPRKSTCAIRGSVACDPIQWELITHSWYDDSQFSMLDSALVQYAPPTIILSAEWKSQTGIFKKVLQVLQGHHYAKIEYANFTFKVHDIERDITRIAGEQATSQFGPLTPTVLWTALSGLLQYHAVLSNVCNFGTYAMIHRDLTAHMQLDGTAMIALNLLPPSSGKIENGSVLQVLSRGNTMMGKRVLERWIRQPLLNKNAIEKRLNVVEFFVQEASLREELMQDGMRGLPDLDTLVHKLDVRRSSFTVNDLVRLYDAAKTTIPDIFTTLASNECNPWYITNSEEMHTIVDHFTGFIHLVEEVVDMDDRSDLKVNPKHCPELSEMYDTLEQIHLDVIDEHSRVRRQLGEEARCEKDKVRGFVFRFAKKKEENRISKLPGYHICQVLANGVHFTSTRLKALGKNYMMTKSMYDKQQAEILSSATETASTYVPVIESASRLVAELDVLLGFAHAAAHAGEGYVRPQFYDDETIHHVDIRQARHPCLELQDHLNFIPNDYTFEETSRLQIITGANMGGKSTYIRTLGTIVIMAQIGSFVPAQSANLPLFDRLLARVGAGDAQQRGVSTFMAEMQEASVLLQRATSHSLVIVDELGRGTSTFDGYGLAYAICDELLKKRCTCLFATHFHELTSMEESEGVLNRHVATHVQEGKVTMVYQVQPGPCLQSYGVHVAEITKFPPTVIAMAKRKAAELEGFNAGMKKNGKTSTSSQSVFTLLQQVAGTDLQGMNENDLQKWCATLALQIEQDPALA